MKSRRLSSRFLWTVMLLVQTACFVWVPSTGAAPRTGQRTQLTLTAEGTAELARYLGPQVAIVEGTLNAVDSDGAMTVDVDQVQLRSGLKQPWTGEGTVVFPRPYVVQLKERQFQKRRSIVASTAFAVVLVTVAITALRQAGAHGGGSDGGSPPP